MSQKPDAMQYGQHTVALYIPSRYKNGQLISEDLIAREETGIRGYLAKRFGGATGADQAHGSFEHDDGRIIDETIRRIWVGVSEKDLGNSGTKEGIFKQAALIAEALDQEAVAVEWSGEIWGVKPSRKQKTVRVPFSAFSPPYQSEMVCMALRRIREPEDMATLLSLNGWGAHEPVPLLENRKLRLLCTKGERQAFSIHEKTRLEIRKEITKDINEGDLLFDLEAPGKIRLWSRQGAQLRGGRIIAVVTPSGRVPRKSVILALALLGSKSEEPLEKLLDRSSLTKRFFKEYSELKDRIAENLEKQGMGNVQANQESQLLMGRIMLLWFLEEKGWLLEEENGKTEIKKNFLTESFRKHSRDYYRDFLEPLFFEILDVPAGKRKQSSPLPFLNGGLFKKTYRTSVTLDDALFSPDRADSIFGTFSRYDFTLTEEAGSHDQVSIDPSMFGHVLESLCAREERKNKGVHYTPPVIAQTLAFESIVTRLADLTGVASDTLKSFIQHDIRSIAAKVAEEVDAALHTLRIVDPAVGSGSLILASLNELMRIKQRCAERLGQPIRPGQYAWARQVRRLVRESLFGVDIDPNAVEVTKLRLWLAIAVGDNEVRPLPDLGHNIRVGDSLSQVREVEDIDQRKLEFDRLSSLRNRYLDRLNDYRNAEGEDARGAGEELETSEREFVIESLLTEGGKTSKSRARSIQKGGATPFYWHIHYLDVFRRAQKGFDIVIANPPYVRIQNLRHGSPESLNDYKNRFNSMDKGASDLYLAFVEQGLRLAGKSGRLAFIMPNFSRTATGECLRNTLSGAGAVERWVDFSDIQIFQTATNYVALLFATARKRRRKTFQCVKPPPASWPPETETKWIDEAPRGTVHYAPLWRTFDSREARMMKAIEKNSTPLGEIVGDCIGVGVQTSADDVYLLKDVEINQNGLASVYSAHLKKRVNIERTMLKLCAKGSLHLRPYHVIKEMFFLWTYNSDHQLLDQQTLVERFPLTWKYLKKCQKCLKGRERNGFNGPDWWRFGKNQGREYSCIPKIVIPSAMNQTTAFFDRTGEIAYTGSGKGGGGAWGISMDLLKEGFSPEWLLAVLNSSVLWQWILLEGDPKNSGWRGVDKKLIGMLPIPLADSKIQDQASGMTLQIEKEIRNGNLNQALANDLDAIVARAFGLEVSGQ